MLCPRFASLPRFTSGSHPVPAHVVSEKCNAMNRPTHEPGPHVKLEPPSAQNLESRTVWTRASAACRSAWECVAAVLSRDAHAIGKVL
jgi:hypothetical protein